MRVKVLQLLLAISLFIAAVYLLPACAPERPPLPDVKETLGQCDRIEQGILVHEIALRDHHSRPVR